MLPQDQEILELLQTGERNGIEALFHRFYKPLVLFAETYLHDWQAAEDLVQEQFIKLWERQSFRTLTKGAISTFLFTVVKNACINQLEKKKISLRTLELPHLQIAQCEAEQMDDAAVKTITAALEKLPQKTRLVVEHVMLKDKMYKEAADELGVSVNTVKTLLKQGIRDLRDMLGDKQEFIFWLLLRHWPE